MRRSRPGRWAAVGLLLPLVACEAPPTGLAEPVEVKPPVNIVLMIGDGMGYGHLEAARLTGGPLVLETLPLRGELVTASADSPITDSAAAATALASGVRTNNSAIGVDPAGRPVRTVTVAAIERGMATALVSTGPIVSATPASFIAHVPDRTMYDEIADQMASSRVDFLFGGGRSWFRSEGRRDLQDRTTAFANRGCAYGESEEVLLLAGSKGCIVGLFASAQMPYALSGRTPSLARMATAALAAVQDNPHGFFLMVEADDIDKRSHANDTAGTIAEVRAFDEAVAAVLEALGDHPNTLVIVTADHETGGLFVATDGARPVIRWTTTNHTPARIPIFASGPGAERFDGVHPITKVGEVLLSLVDRR